MEAGTKAADPAYVKALYAASVTHLAGKPIDRLPQYVLGWQVTHREVMSE
jgi:hypothetical protein